MGSREVVLNTSSGHMASYRKEDYNQQECFVIVSQECVRTNICVFFPCFFFFQSCVVISIKRI